MSKKDNTILLNLIAELKEQIRVLQATVDAL